MHHVLCLGLKQPAENVEAVIATTRDTSASLAREAAVKLRQGGMRLQDLEGLPEESYRAHDVIRAALAEGLASNYSETVRIIVTEYGARFAAAASFCEVVEACHAAGGVAIIAHPGRAEYGFGRATAEDIGRMRRQAGLDGIEVYHWSHSRQQETGLLELANSLGMLVSCGSDSHGPGAAKPLVGRRAELCQPLLERLGFTVE